MMALLTTTLISLIINFDCWDNMHLPREDDKFLYTDLFLPDWMYERGYIETVTLFCIIICSMFILLVA